MSDTPYHELYRPQFHFTARRDWLNDPNGLVFYDGEYHLCFQHTPGSLAWGPNTWGHAVSRDLVRWQQIAHAVEPDEMGWIWSGSAVVDHDNTAGFQTGEDKVIVAVYTAGDNTESTPVPCAQCIAYSNDRGRTFTKYEGNPVVAHIRADNRDPKVLRHEPSGQWVMALYLDGEDYVLLASPDLKHWEKLCDVPMPGISECPDFFELPIDGDPTNTRWIFWGGNGNYRLGFFDGKTFEPETGPIQSNFGGNSYAGQSWSDIPAADGRWSDGRRLQITWMAGGQYPDMPFNQQMSFPVEVTLRSTPDGPRLHREPVREIELLHGARHAWGNLTLRPGENPLAGLSGDLFDLRAVIEPGSAEEVAFVLRGEPVVYNVARQEISCLRTQASSGHTAPLRLIDGRIQLRMLLDRTSLEVFGNHGEISMPTCFLPDQENLSLAVQATGGEAKIVELEVAEVRSAWD
jgi:sucrose-6-phosphate hydrolase SacC (GH32 family)